MAHEVTLVAGVVALLVCLLQNSFNVFVSTRFAYPSMLRACSSSNWSAATAPCHLSTLSVSVSAPEGYFIRCLLRRQEENFLVHTSSSSTGNVTVPWWSKETVLATLMSALSIGSAMQCLVGILRRDTLHLVPFVCQLVLDMIVMFADTLAAIPHLLHAHYRQMALYVNDLPLLWSPSKGSLPAEEFSTRLLLICSVITASRLGYLLLMWRCYRRCQLIAKYQPLTTVTAAGASRSQDDLSTPPMGDREWLTGEEFEQGAKLVAPPPQGHTPAGVFCKPVAM